MTLALALALALTALVAGCGESAKTPTVSVPPGPVVLAKAPVAALAALPKGALLAGPLEGGPIQRIAADGTVTQTRLQVPAVTTEGQRGLLSLLAAKDGTRIYATWVTPRRRLIVGRLSAGAPQIVWRGPITATFGNGGHLVWAPDGRIVLGIGDRQSPRGAVGEILSLDPAGPASQRPRVLSRGWHNPFALTFTPDGNLWVADNVPGKEGERLARGDLGTPQQITLLPPNTAPSGLEALPNGDLALCGFRSTTLDRYRLDGESGWKQVKAIAGDCQFGVVRLTDGRLAYAGARAVRSIAP